MASTLRNAVDNAAGRHSRYAAEDWYKDLVHLAGTRLLDYDGFSALVRGKLKVSNGKLGIPEVDLQTLFAALDSQCEGLVTVRDLSEFLSHDLGLTAEAGPSAGKAKPGGQTNSPGRRR
eukprot:TRINITY_DN8011_c0_g2_i1.p4 TRINITY_DN8011_c0_g2~~TRINITY_DN8011_c0_g2_i1.p4  ORF type:complete len:119 (-),score=25.17 TRINITY_DN8011_c0_g2_i1:614-970(-)